MKDIKNLLIYGGISVVAILALIYMHNEGGVSSAVVGYTAIFFVIVLPVIIAVKIGAKEREQKNQDS